MADGVAKLPSNRAAIYARVSTDDKGQTPDNQLLQLRAWCERMGYRIVREYVEHENGGKGIEYRKQLAAMFAGAPRREFDLLLVWSLDRFSREGMAATVGYLHSLASHGVAFRSLTEEHLSAENELVRNILLATLASLANLEREKISRRTKTGLERARARGKVLGRPKFRNGDREKLIAAVETGDSWHAVSRKSRIPYSTVKKNARILGYKPPERTGKPRPPPLTKLERGYGHRLYCSAIRFFKSTGAADFKIDFQICGSHLPARIFPVPGPSWLSRVPRCSSQPLLGSLGEAPGFSIGPVGPLYLSPFEALSDPHRPPFARTLI